MSEQSEKDRWNERYAGDDYLFGTSPNAFLTAQRHLLVHGQTALAQKRVFYRPGSGHETTVRTYLGLSKFQ